MIGLLCGDGFYLDDLVLTKVCFGIFKFSHFQWEQLTSCQFGSKKKILGK